MFEIGRLTRLALGYESESNSRPIEICVADWLADWPGATIGLLLMRPGEETYYPAASKVVDGVLHFTPSRADMAIPGDGLAQIVMTDENDVELRSRVVRTMIECSLPGSEAEAPEEPMRPFVDQVLEAAASAAESAASAGKAAGNAEADAGRAEAAADNAEAAAKRAEEAAGMIGPGGGGTGTVTSVNGVQPDEAGNVEMEIPQAAEDVGADPAGTAASKVSTHNADEDAHPAIRQLISDLSGRLSALADSDDTTLDQLSEIVAYIKSNKSLIDSITTGKVSTADIVNNLTSTATNKPLSAAQGKALKALIDAIAVPTKLSELEGDATHRVVTDAEKTAWNAKSTFSGAYADLTGKPTKVSAFENDTGYLTEHQDISHLLPRTELGAAVDVALAEAKESGAFDGADGVGIKSVVQTTTSSENGGTNILTVTKTDGSTSTFAVKNGKGGAKGDKGDKGDDYILTEADKEEIATLVPTVKEMETPTIVDSVDDMTDPTKHYVLDGYIWHNKTVFVPGESVTTYPNQLIASAATLNVRYSISSASTTTKNGYFFTDFIAATNYASNTPYNVRLNWEMPFSTATDVKVIYYNTSKVKIGATMLIAANTTAANGETVIDLKTIAGSNSTVPTASEVAYVRLQLAINSSLAALTTADLAKLTITFDAIFETESTESVTTKEWVNSGIAYAPIFHTDMIGVLGANNVVYLSDNLPAGTYTLKYGDDYATVGTITVM